MGCSKKASIRQSTKFRTNSEIEGDVVHVKLV